jgi:multiple sugar transport system permease protein
MQSSYAGSTNRFAYALIAPVVAIMLLVIVFPVLDTARLSFFNATFIKPGLDAPFIGFKNYFSALNDKLFWRALWITAKWTIASIVFQFALGFGLALLVNCKVRGAKVIRSLYLIPWMLPGALAALMWKWMYHGSIGLLNYVLYNQDLRMSRSPGCRNRKLCSGRAVAGECLGGAPFFMIMLLGGLKPSRMNYMSQPKLMGRISSNVFSTLRFRSYVL